MDSIRKLALKRLKNRTGLPGSVWGEDAILEEMALIEKELPIKGEDVSKGTVQIELSVPYLLDGLDALLLMVRKGESFPEIPNQLVVENDEGVAVAGHYRLSFGRQPIRESFLRALRTGARVPGRPEPKMDLSQLMSDDEVMDIGRVQPPKGGSLQPGSRYFAANNRIETDAGRWYRAALVMETLVPVTSEGVMESEVFRMYGQIFRTSDNRFSRYMTHHELRTAFPEYVCLIPFIGKAAQGVEEIESLVPLKIDLES